jgi:hypothetical protein
MPNPWFSILVAAFTGGLMGAIVNVLYNYTTTRSAAAAKQQAAIEALAAELKRCRTLCDYNAGLKDDSTGPFIEFPIGTALDVSFEEREKFPKLLGIQENLVHYTLGLMHINQLIELHHLLWTSSEQPTGVNPGAAGRRDKLRLRICDICSGNLHLEGVGPENFISVPKYIELITSQLQNARK